MSSIDAISTSSWNTVLNGTSATDKDTDTKADFSAMLADLKSGGGTGKKSSGSGDSDEETATVTQVMSDGSVLVTVYQGDEIISQTKTRAANAEENPHVLSTTFEKSGGAADSQANSAIAGSAAALMLNALMQN